MDKMPRIQDFMTALPHSIGLDQHAGAARNLMRKFGIRHLPVEDGGRLVGIVSDRDIQFAMGWEQKSEKELEIKDVYIPEPYAVSPNTELDEVASRMAADKIGCALIVNDGELLGIFTATDACKILAQVLDRFYK